MENTPKTRVAIKRAIRRTLEGLKTKGVLPQAEVLKVELDGDKAVVTFTASVAWFHNDDS